MMTQLRGIAVLVCGLAVLTPAIPVAEDDVPQEAEAIVNVEPPEGYSGLEWHGPKLNKHGWWFSDEQVAKIERRMEYLTTAAAKECVDVQIAEAKKMNPWIKIAGGILTGIAIGFCAAHSSHCGITK